MWAAGLWAAGLLILATAPAARADEALGRVRITDAPIQSIQQLQQIQLTSGYEPYVNDEGEAGDYIPASYGQPFDQPFVDPWGPDCFDGICYQEKGLGKTPFGKWFNHHSAMYKMRNKMQSSHLHAYKMNQRAMFHARNQQQSAALKAHLRCKYGYFIPTGCGGAGCPLIGKYKVAYPVDPGYFDGRDGGLYSAQGYGVPVAVPLAPTVLSTYNYSWGVPASRLTPITHPFP